MISLNLTSNHDAFHLLPNSKLSISFRFLLPGDQSEVKCLCRDWFPIEYPDAWYDDIVQQKKYYALAACDTTTQGIVALLVAKILPFSNCNREDQQILHQTFDLSTSVCYILILGVMKEYRRQGLASVLLEHLLNALNSYTTCKAIYLHVLHSNKQAIQFYQSKSFQYRTHLPYYYVIKGEHCDAYCFVRYINGGYPPFTFLDCLSHLWRYVIGSQPCRLFSAMRHFVQKNFLYTNTYQRTTSYKEISRII